MKTDAQAAEAGIDTLERVAEGMVQLRDSFSELGTSAYEQFATASKTVQILKDAREPKMVITSYYAIINENRALLINMRDGLLAANRFDWAVLCTHAIWWLSAILDI